jgi:FixJ family two-component response regulator
VCYASAEALLEAASKALPHGCLVVDLRMDGMSGLSLAKTLHKRDADLPVITLTAHDTDQARSEASRGGVTSFLRKPVTDQVLLGAIVSALDRTVATHNGSEPARSGADRPSKQTP